MIFKNKGLTKLIDLRKFKSLIDSNHKFHTRKKYKLIHLQNFSV